MEETIIAPSAMSSMVLIAFSIQQLAQLELNGSPKAANQTVNVEMEITWMGQDSAEFSHKFAFLQPLGMVRDAQDRIMPVLLEHMLKEINACLMFPVKMAICGILPISSAFALLVKSTMGISVLIAPPKRSGAHPLVASALKEPSTQALLAKQSIKIDAQLSLKPSGKTTNANADQVSPKLVSNVSAMELNWEISAINVHINQIPSGYKVWMNVDARPALQKSISIVFHRDPTLALMTPTNVQPELSLKAIIECVLLALLDV